MKKRGPGFEKVFEFCYNYKQKWTRSGRKTPIVDGIVFNKVEIDLFKETSYCLFLQDNGLGLKQIYLFIFSRSVRYSGAKWSLSLLEELLYQEKLMNLSESV